jgi:hypothetical protein
MFMPPTTFRSGWLLSTPGIEQQQQQQEQQQQGLEESGTAAEQHPVSCRVPVVLKTDLCAALDRLVTTSLHTSKAQA